MKQIAILSGKGGTGKTTLAAALANLFKNPVLADCDVDASNLYLLFKPEILSLHQFYGGKTARIIEERCTGCGACEEVCRFDAVSVLEQSEVYTIDPYACEGCKACVFACDFDAIVLENNLKGYYYLSRVDNTPLVYAQLRAGEENSGWLVAEVRQLASKTAEEHGQDFIIIDGAPGIACPVTSSIVGTNHIVIVTEASLSALHDLKRLIETINQYHTPFSIVINKYDLNPSVTEKIKTLCKDKKYPLLGQIPFDPLVPIAAIEGKPITAYSQSNALQAIQKIFSELLKLIL